MNSPMVDYYRLRNDSVLRQLGGLFWEARRYRRFGRWTEALDAYTDNPNVIDGCFGGVSTADLRSYVETVIADVDASLRLLTKYSDHVLDLIVPTMPLSERPQL